MRRSVGSIYRHLEGREADDVRVRKGPFCGSGQVKRLVLLSGAVWWRPKVSCYAWRCHTPCSQIAEWAFGAFGGQRRLRRGDHRRSRLDRCRSCLPEGGARTSYRGKSQVKTEPTLSKSAGVRQYDGCGSCLRACLYGTPQLYYCHPKALRLVINPLYFMS